MALHLYCWVVGPDYDGKHVTVVATSVEEARSYVADTAIIEVLGDYDFDLNDVCREGDNKGYTWKEIIADTEPAVFDLTLGKINAFQYGTG